MREMRRKKQQLSAEQAEKIIRRNTYGVLSLSDPEGQPYGVPLNYVYADGKFYFHCALAGKKNDIIAANQKASLCIVDNDTVVPDTYSTDYISVIASGTIHFIEEKEEILRALWALTDALGGGDHAAKEKEIMGGLSHVKMLCFEPEDIRGKAGSYMMKRLEEFDL